MIIRFAGDRVRVGAGLVALLAAGLGALAVVARVFGVWEGGPGPAAAPGPLLLGVRLLPPVLLAIGGHLCARREDDRGPVLLAALGLLLADSLVTGARDLVRLPVTTTPALLGLGQALLGALAGAVAWTRRGAVDGAGSLLGGMEPARRPVVIAPVVLLALAALYPSVAGDGMRALQPLLVVLGGPRGLPTLVAALAIVLLAPVAARATPSAGALALLSLAVVTLGRLALQLDDVLAERVAATVWLWLELLAAVTLLALAGRVLGARGQ